VLAADAPGAAQALRAATFAVVSTMTSTGFFTDDFDTWNDFARLVLLALMFVGGCAGSTSGGMKVIRVMLLGKTALQEAQRQLQPKAIQILRMPARVFSEDVRRNVLGFYFTYITVWAAATLAMTALGLDLVSATSSVAGSLNVSGTGFGEVGPSENFSAAPPAGRVLLALLMLVGRLEVFTVVALLTPAFWRSRWA
jgi:trk system potassium uptake protein